MPQLFKRVKSSEEVFNSVHTCNDASCQDVSYPPSSPTVKRMMQYMLENKKLPVEIPQIILQKSKHGKAFNTFPKHLVPEEVECRICKEVLSEPMMITCQAKIVTFHGVIQGVSTYYKLCNKCNLTYRYQEWSDGLHNFNDNVILSLHLCVVLRNSLQNHMAVGRVVQIIEATEGESLPKGDLIMQAYLHFEALSDLDYIYSCVSCGYNPSTVIMDLHKKGVFSIPVSEIQSPPATYDGHVDIEEFWDAVAMDMISRGFYPSGKENPFTVSPSYHNWSPWIGPKTRESAMVLNTESAKVQSSTDGSDIDVPFTEERLGDELLHLKIQDLKKLCRQCGVDVVGSKMDLILRLRNKMSNRVTYNKVFEQVWGASAVQSQCDPKCCPNPVVTSLNVVKASKTFWGTMPNEGQQQLLNNALDIEKCKDEPLATVYNTTLIRSDLCCLGLENDIEGTVLNCCLKVVETIAKSQNVNVFSANSYQIATWPNRTLEEHLLHLPLDEKIDWFIFPTWIPGHWMVCLMNPGEHDIFFLDPLHGQTFSQEEYMLIYRNIAQILSPGPWHEYCVNDITGLPQQHLSNSCGVFVLMPDVPCIRRWWCLLLLENFPLRSDGERRATKRQMRHTEKNLPMEVLEMILLEVVLQDGDAAYMNLSLTCSCFRAIVNKARFRQKAHYAWLDSKCVKV
ncbi:uncharacterized protein LOC131538714 isoform X2 [Onychostoma macrolepis]|uniref:uncharacterized protein LOC131538714 isoform X2 n=1 Tax=Onychostoma macrolepis TaxID=369639 RepID=UPI00272AA2F1|nr:uncharacterized protein LOC131538714 isoform X2 [Onychostoma macrolepis]